MTGKLITFEGGDGCGKSTQLAMTADWLRAKDVNVLTTFEPGDNALGGEIRSLLLSGAHQPSAEAELLLFLADRAQHVYEVIRPAIAQGAWILCDRYTDSTRAYQLAGRKIEAASVDMLLQFAELGMRPDLTLWLDLPVQEALMRLHNRQEEKPDRMDKEIDSFHEQVRNGFEQIASHEPERVRRIDATGNTDQVQKLIRQALEV